jgi:hypothetical protein
MPLTATEASRLLQTSVAGQTYNLSTATKVGLETSATVPTGATAGTAITGDPRQGPTGWNTPTTASGITAITNLDAFTFTNMPAVSSPGVRYFSVYDSAATPNRKWYGQLAADRVTVSGDNLTFAAGALSLGVVTSVQTTASI